MIRKSRVKVISKMIKKYRKGIFYNLLGSAILAFGMYNIHSISNITEGGTLGLVLLISHYLGINPSISNAVITAICYFVGFRTFGREFIILSAFSAGGFSAFYALFSSFKPIYPKIASMPLLAAIIGALFVGVGVGVCVRFKGAPTGDDALAMTLREKIHIPIQWIYLISDLAVLLASLTYIPVRKIAYSLITVTISGQIIGFLTKSKEN